MANDADDKRGPWEGVWIAGYWQQRAKEVRLLGHDIDDSAAKETMEHIASLYDWMAAWAAERKAQKT